MGVLPISSSLRPNRLRRPRYTRYSPPAIFKTVKATADRSSRTATPIRDAQAQAAIPAATPQATTNPARRPERSTVRVTISMSGPGMTISSPISAT